jgi:hypothetical protein
LNMMSLIGLGHVPFLPSSNTRSSFDTIEHLYDFESQ